jgi:hypothetical protein
MPDRFRTGDEIRVSAAEYNALAVALEQDYDLTASGGLRLQRGPAGRALALPRDPCLYATLSGSASPYSWTQALAQSGGTFGTGARTGTTNAHEVNSTASLAGKVVRICPGYPGDWRFYYRDRTPAVTEPSVNCADLCSNANVPATLYLHDGVNAPLTLPNIVAGSSCTWRACRLMTMTGSRIGCSGGSTGQIPVMITFAPGSGGGGAGYILSFQIPVYSFGGTSWDTAGIMTCTQLTNYLNTGISGCSNFDGGASVSTMVLVSDQTLSFTISNCTLGAFSATITLTTESTTTSGGNVGNFAAFYGTSRSLTFTIDEVPT